ncbi:MAG: carbohydrate binding family 9 domain-containing protein [Ignavibacteriales bacterium]|nr:carbohydrate binding family 9 domain-containing protein [Ignavibacteriales bacterium]MCB9258410.1 carbohydrate binding family 9 domain-containing protein [Ignavibacteriales bacterium]
MRSFTVLLLFVITLNILGKGNSNIPSVQAYKTFSEIKLDGILNESVYQNEPVTNFTQKIPDEGQPATEESKIWITYDDENIYFSANFLDSQPGSIDQNLMRRDNVVPSDWFFIYMDPYNDDRTGYFFAVNPGGSIADGILFNDSWDDNSWDGIWEAKTKVNDDGWTAEIKIPFSQLRFKESENMVWGINLNRDIKRRNENSFLVMVPSKESGFVSRFADLVGLDGITPKQRFEVLPYFVQKAQYLIHDSDDPFYSGNQYKTSFGADFKIGLSSNLNIDATVNPDFGQVEVDPAVVNLSAFETYFEEKRSFFIEGNNLFYFGVGGANNNWGFNFGNPELFYSRRIGKAPSGDIPDNDFADYPRETRILGAAKLTGKIDETWSIGGLSAFTERTYATISNNQKKSNYEIEPFTHFGVLRSQKEFNDNRQALGFMFTSANRDLRTDNLSNSLAQNAYTFGIDGWTFLDSSKTYVLTGYFAGSHLNGSKEALVNIQERPYRYFQRPDATYIRLDSNRTSLGGYYTRLALNKQEGNFYINSAIGAVSPGFENSDLGFQWMADKINGHVVLGYRWYEPGEIFRRTMIYAAHFRDYDFEGNNLNNGFMIFSFMQFMNYYNLEMQLSYNLEEYNKSLTRGGPLSKNPEENYIGLEFSTDSRKELVFGFDIGYENNTLTETWFNFEPFIEWKPSSQISITFGPEYTNNFSKRQWIDNFKDEFAVETYKQRYVFGEINQESISANIRLNWTITPKMSLQLFMQPLISVGKFDNFKELAKPGEMDFNEFNNVVYNGEDEEYIIDPDGNGPASEFAFSNPDFNYKSLRGTLVYRWEILPGSIFYLVWSHDRANFDHPGKFKFGRDFNDLLYSDTNDIFLAKFSYWLDL